MTTIGTRHKTGLEMMLIKNWTLHVNNLTKKLHIIFIVSLCVVISKAYSVDASELRSEIGEVTISQASECNLPILNRQDLLNILEPQVLSRLYSKCPGSWQIG